jgi:hypothetical protein
MLNIPVITLSGKSLALAFEKAIVSLYEKGIRFKIQYYEAEPGIIEKINKYDSSH